MRDEWIDFVGTAVPLITCNQHSSRTRGVCWSSAVRAATAVVGEWVGVGWRALLFDAAQHVVQVATLLPMMKSAPRRCPLWEAGRSQAVERLADLLQLV